MKTYFETVGTFDSTGLKRNYFGRLQKSRSSIELVKDLGVEMCQKVFRRRMVLEEEKGNLVKVAVGILEREKVQIDKVAL